jgi:hypothetical protein
MNTKLLSMARRNYLYVSDQLPVPLSTQRHNVLQWARSVHRLGDKWLFAKHYNFCNTKEKEHA